MSIQRKVVLHGGESLVEQNLDIEVLDLDLYRNAVDLVQPRGARGVYGGIFIK